MNKYISSRISLLFLLVTFVSFVNAFGFANATTPLLIGNNPANVVSVSNSIIDLGQSTTFNVIVSNGIAPYTGNWMWIAPNTIQANSLSVTTNTLTANILNGGLINSVLIVSTSSGSTNTIQVTFNGITNTLNLDSTHTVYGTWTFNANVIDSASNTLGSATQTTSNTVTINPTLALPTIAASNTLADANQYIRFSAYETGGTPPYTYNILVYNSVTNVQIGNFLSSSANSFVFQAFAGNSIYANVMVTDSASTPVTLNSVLTSTIPVNAVLATPTIAASNTLVENNQYIRFSSYAAGGTLPYTYNFLVYNSITNVQVANMLTTSNSFLWQVTGNSGNTLVANVFVTDGASTPVTVNSLLTGTITVNSVLQTPTISPSSAQSVNYGQSVTFAAYVAGGVPPYTYNFIVYNYNTNIQVANMLTSSNSFAYTIPSGENGNVLVANVFVTDSASVPVQTNSILSGEITVTSPPPCPNCVQGSGGSGVFLTTTIVKTTTTVPQTTVPQTTIPPTTTIPFSINANYTFSNSSVTNINATTVGLLLTIVAQGNSSKGKVVVTNVTNNVPQPPSGFAGIIAVNISVGAPNVSTNVTFNYPCAIQASKVAPYKLENGTWQSISKFTVNAAGCSVAFSITNDPVIGIFHNTAQQPTSTAVNPTTVPPPLTAQTTVPAYSSSTSTGAYVLWLVVAVIVIILVLWYLNKGRKRRLK